jgi:hypothetical protein
VVVRWRLSQISVAVAGQLLDLAQVNTGSQ